MVTDKPSMYMNSDQMCYGNEKFFLMHFNSSKYQLNVADYGFFIGRRWHVPHVEVVLNVEVLLVFVSDGHVRQTFAPQAEEHEGREAERDESDDRRKEKDCPGKSVGRNLVKKSLF
jgi:hypothetical protein